MRTRPKSIVRPCSWVGCGGEGVRWEECGRRWGQERKERQGLAGLKQARMEQAPPATSTTASCPEPRRRLRYRASYVRPISVLFPLLGPPPGVRSSGAPLACVVRAPSPAAAPTVADSGRIRPAPRPTPSRLSLHAGAHFPPRRVLVIPSTRRLELFLPTAAPICVPLPQHSMHAPCIHSTRLVHSL